MKKLVVLLLAVGMLMGVSGAVWADNGPMNSTASILSFGSGAIERGEREVEITDPVMDTVSTRAVLLMKNPTSPPRVEEAQSIYCSERLDTGFKVRRVGRNTDKLQNFYYIIYKPGS